MSKLFIAEWALMMILSYSVLYAEIGGFVGLTASNYTGKGVESSKYLNGISKYEIGGFYNRKFYRNYGMEIDFIYCFKGAIFEEFLNVNATPGNALMVTRTISADYLEIPILFNYVLPQWKTLFPKVFIGPTFNYRFTDDYEYSHKDEPNFKDEFELEKTDYGLTFGGRIGFMLDDRNTLSVDFRYVRGLKKVNAKANDEIYNNSFEVMFGYYRR